MTETLEPAAMHTDESLPAFRPPTRGSDSGSGTKLPAPTWAKGPATPGGVPPMFAGSHGQPSGERGGALGH